VTADVSGGYRGRSVCLAAESEPHWKRAKLWNAVTHYPTESWTPGRTDL